MTEQFVIVGAGLAGAKAAQALREEGFTGNIVLIGTEEVRPYERPPLSKDVLQGKADDGTVFVHPDDWYAENRVDLRTGVTAVAIDRSARNVRVSDGSTVGYDRLLLTTGSSPRRLEIPGADLDGVLYLRTLDDSRELRRRLTPGVRVVIVGAGWVGLEVAAAARAMDADVTIIDMAQLPLQLALGDELGSVFAELHRAHDVRFRFGTTLRSINGNGGAVRSVTVNDAEDVPADIVVVGVGIQPNTQLAKDAGLAVANGVSVDEQLRTSDPRIFAAGDVASAVHPLVGASIRVEHWANALNGGPAAARSMLDQPGSYDRLPYFFTDQYDFGCEYTGYVTPSQYDRVVFRGDPTIHDGKAPAFIAFWVSGDRVLAAMNVNIWDVQDSLQRLVRAGYAGQRVDLTALGDPDTPLDELVVT